MGMREFSHKVYRKMGNELWGNFHIKYTGKWEMDMRECSHKVHRKMGNGNEGIFTNSPDTRKVKLSILEVFNFGFEGRAVDRRTSATLFPKLT